MKNKFAPIVVFVFNRVEYTKLTIEALKKNELSQYSDLFIYSDIDKNRLDTNVDKVRRYISKIDGFKSVTLIERKEHYGLARSIISGVTEVVNKYGKIIVLEDDLVVSKYFLSYMNNALNFYVEEKEVMHIAGYVHPIRSDNLEDTYFIKPTSCWGWATWDRAWKYFRKDVDFYLEEFDQEMIKDFNLNNKYKHFNQIRGNKSGELNTWAVFWYASVYLNNGLSLHPKHSFVRNIGHNSDNSTNCRNTSDYDVNLFSGYNSKTFAFTTKIEEDKTARRNLESFFRKKFIKSVFTKVKIIVSKLSKTD